LLASVGVDLAAVELLPLFLVAEQVEGGGDPLEPLIGRRIAGVLVGMQFLGELAERLLDFVRACAPRNAQFRCRDRPPRRMPLRSITERLS